MTAQASIPLAAATAQSIAMPVTTPMTLEMSGLRKAAILIMAVGEELAKSLFQSLSDADVQCVTEEITRMGEIPMAQLTQVVTEFYGLLETQQYMIRGGQKYASKLLTEAFGESRANELLHLAGDIRERNEGDLATLQKMEPQQLSKFLENENPQTVALVLAHLDAKRGAMVLMHLGAGLRVEALRRLAEMRQFSPEMAQKVALVLHRRMESLGSGTGSRSYSGYKGVAEMLNRLDQVTSNGILEAIEQQEPKVAIGIRTLMFTFDDLITVPEQSIRELVGAADKKTLGMALKGAKENIKAQIWKAMSSRAAEMLKEDMEAMGPVRSKDVQAAQQELLTLAQKLESEGKLVLKMEPENDLSV